MITNILFLKTMHNPWYHFERRRKILVHPPNVYLKQDPFASLVEEKDIGPEILEEFDESVESVVTTYPTLLMSRVDYEKRDNLSTIEILFGDEEKCPMHRLCLRGFYRAYQDSTQDNLKMRLFMSGDNFSSISRWPDCITNLSLYRSSRHFRYMVNIPRNIEAISIRFDSVFGDIVFTEDFRLGFVENHGIWPSTIYLDTIHDAHLLEKLQKHVAIHFRFIELFYLMKCRRRLRAWAFSVIDRMAREKYSPKKLEALLEAAHEQNNDDYNWIDVVENWKQT